VARVVIPESILPGTLWVCYRDHWHLRGTVCQGSTALLTEVRQGDGTVEYLRASEMNRMDWVSFSQCYVRKGCAE